MVRNPTALVPVAILPYSAVMLNKATINDLITILKKDCKRAMQLKVSGFPRLYYCFFLLRDVEWFNTWAGSGSTFRRRSDHTRNVYCDLRVGSYHFDQTTDGGLFDNDEEVDSHQYVKLPIDDKCYDGLRIALWKLSETKFREALTDYSNKRAADISTVNPNRKLNSFLKTKPHHFIRYKRRDHIEEDKWVRFCKNASKWLSELTRLSGNWVEFDVIQESKIFVNTEGSVIVQHLKTFSLIVTIRRLTPEGSHIEQELVYNCASQDELPNMRQFKKDALTKFMQLEKISRSKKIHSFSGPVLLYPTPAGLLFHEAIGHRLEGNRLLYSGEGQTFKGQTGKKIFNVDITIRDNPKLKSFRGRKCVGSYDFDDEGTPARDTLLVENGILRDFLNTRAACCKKNFQPNGHARNKNHQRPISRMAVMIVKGKEVYPTERLREMLVEEIKKQGKPFGMIVYETSGGETETTSYDFQAFFGEISYATLVYPDGRETPIRGVDFIGTPLQALNNIIAVGDTPELDNGYCGAESGMVPVSTISPAVLISDLELQTKEEELVTQYILPSPRL